MMTQTRNDFISTAPTLMVGLGGLGCYTVATLYSQLSQEQKRYVQAIILDTDVNELREPLYDELRNTGSTIQTSRQGTVKECINQLEMPSIAKWFNQHGLGHKQMTDGAAQVRSISRLAMLDTISSNRINRLNTKLNNLLNVRNRDGNLAESCRVIIINSVAGGTGSGSFLQLSLYIQEYFKQRNITNVSVRSFTIMPDVFIENGDYENEDLANNVRANGYAALKEVDACTSIRFGKYTNNTQGSPFYPVSLELKGATEEHISEGAAPFDVVTLIDYVNTKGENLGHKNNYVNNMMDVIRLHLFSPLVGKGGIASQTDNLANHHIAHGNRSCYASAGVANLEYPVADMVKYAALRWATDGISKNWLEIDEQINDEFRKIEKERKEGIYRNAPDRHERFTQILREKCEVDKPSIFYRNIYNDLFLLNEYGERGNAKHELWLKKISDLINQTTKAIVQEKAHIIPSLEQERLQDAGNVESQVRQSELGLERYHNELINRVQNTGLTIANNAIWSPYRNQVSSTNNDAELNRWLIPPTAEDSVSKAMHPLAMRYFLSQVIGDLNTKLTKVKSDKGKLDKQIENYANAYDDARTDAKKESAADIARENTKFINRIKGGLKDFAEEYITKSRAQKESIEKFARLTIEEECYTTLLGYLETMVDAWYAWFNGLGNIVSTNQRKIKELSTLHEDRLNPTTIYILSSAEIKEALWEEESTYLANSDFPPEISEQIYLTIYRDKGREYIDHLPPKPRLNWVEKQFDDSVLSWCTKKIYDTGFNIDVGKALIKELELNQKLGVESIDTTIDEKLQFYMSQLKMLATPLINLNNENAGQDFAFTCMNPETQKVFSQQQIAQSFGNPFVKNGFSKYRITQLNLKQGLISTDLRALNIDGGLYRKAYEERILKSRQIPRQSTSPHLDERWNSPAYLPEIDDAAQIRAIKQIYQACIINQAYHYDGKLKPTIYPLTKDMRSLWHWSRGGQQDVAIPSVDGHDALATLYNLVDVFAINFVLVGEILNNEQSRMSKDNITPEQSPVIRHAVPLITSIESIMDNPPSINIASDRQQQLLYAIFEFIKESLSVRYPPNTTNAKFLEITDNIQEQLTDISMSDDYRMLVQHIIKKCTD